MAIFAILAGTAHADDSAVAATAKAAVEEVEEIIVTGSPIRESLEASLVIQRNADNVLNAITSDDAGRFLVQTVAAALARLPGIGVQRDQGQEHYVQVHDAPTRWTFVSFDGVNVLGAEERVLRFDSVPAALISTVELNKTLLADMPAEALAARVNIKSYSALDKPGFHGYLDLGYGFVDLGDGPQARSILPRCAQPISNEALRRRSCAAAPVQIERTHTICAGQCGRTGMSRPPTGRIMDERPARPVGAAALCRDHARPDRTGGRCGHRRASRGSEGVDGRAPDGFRIRLVAL